MPGESETELNGFDGLSNAELKRRERIRQQRKKRKEKKKTKGQEEKSQNVEMSNGVCFFFSPPPINL